MSSKIEKGMDTEAIATLIEFSMPPRRQDGEGISVKEICDKLNCTKDHGKKILDSRDDLTCVIMLNNVGKQTYIWLPIEDAKKYENWIKTS